MEIGDSKNAGCIIRVSQKREQDPQEGRRQNEASASTVKACITSCEIALTPGCPRSAMGSRATNAEA